MRRALKSVSERHSAFKKILVVGQIFAVPQTDSGGQDEKSKVSERTIFKELGKKSRRNLERCRPTQVGATNDSQATV